MMTLLELSIDNVIYVCIYTCRLGGVRLCVLCCQACGVVGVVGVVGVSVSAV
jgi:hypothetical protein